MNERKQVVSRFWEKVWEQGDFDAMQEILARGYVLHDLVNSKDRDTDDLRGLLSDIRNALPDLRLSIEDQISAEESKVVTRFKVHVPGQSVEVSLSGMSISHVSRGKIDESWLVWEALRAEQEIEPDVQVWWWPPWRR